ncbi:MAG: hypothetical protein AB7G13_27005 [Lautropia sp.]
MLLSPALRSGVSTCLTALLICAAGHVYAQAQIATPPPLYTCQDADGRTISSDRPIAACATRPMRELNSDGSVRRVIPPPMTKEQERQQADAERRRRMEDLDRRARVARDRNLLLTFEDEQALEAIRRRTLAEIDHEIVYATQRILASDRELKAAQKAVEAWRAEKPGRVVPFSMQQRVTDAANSILADNALITDRASERERLNARFDADALRLRELLGRPADDRFASRQTPPSSQ